MIRTILAMPFTLVAMTLVGIGLAFGYIAYLIEGLE